jgi:hypothetical protein
MHLYNCSEELTNFLNDLDKHIYTLIKPNALSILNDVNKLNDIQCIILYGNESIYCETFFHVYLKNKYGSYTKYVKDYEEVEYIYSDYHYEMNYNDKYIGFLKQILNNNNILGRKNVFLLKNFDHISFETQQHILKLLEKNSAQFFIITKSLSKICQPIISRSNCLNMSFPIENMKKFTNGKDIEKSLMLTIADLDNKPNFELLLDNLILKLSKCKNELEVITSIREYCYKIYHLCIPLSYIAKYTINHLKTHKKIFDIVQLAAKCDHILTISSKDLLIYETFFIELYQIL